MIRIENINKQFKKLHALNGINVHFNKGQVISLIGPNGSGKTTLIKSILGLVKPDSGQIFFNDEAISQNVEYRKNIGYMPQIGRYPDNMKIGQLFKMIKNIRAEKEWDEELYYRFKLDTILDKSMKALSGGTRQKVSAALAFLFNPDVLILDEPTAGLDPISSGEIDELILTLQRERQMASIVVTHDLHSARANASRLALLNEGNVVVEGTFDELQQSDIGFVKDFLKQS